MRAVLASFVLPAPVNAVMVADCGDYRSSVQSLAEPSEANARTFAKGDIRLTVADTVAVG